MLIRSSSRDKQSAIFCKEEALSWSKNRCALLKTILLGIENVRCPWMIYVMTGRHIRSFVRMYLLLFSWYVQEQQMQLACCCLYICVVLQQSCKSNYKQMHKLKPNGLSSPKILVELILKGKGKIITCWHQSIYFKRIVDLVDNKTAAFN